MALAVLDDLMEAALATIPGSVASDDGKALIRSLTRAMLDWVDKIQRSFPKAELLALVGGILQNRIEGEEQTRETTLRLRDMAGQILKIGFQNRSVGFEAILANHLRVAYMVAVDDVERDMRTTFGIQESAEMREASLQAEFLDRPIPKEVTDWAQRNAGVRVTKISESTQKELARTIADAMAGDRRGVPDVARAIEAKFAEMSGPRSELIATTEMNFAMSQGTIDRGTSMGANRKAWITVGDDRVSRKICRRNGRQNRIPIRQPFQSGHGQPPGHPRCRCAPATFGATEETARHGFSDAGRASWLGLIGAGIAVAAFVKPIIAQPEGATT